MEKMEQMDFPSLYVSADTASLRLQKYHFRCLAWYLLLTSVAAVVPLLPLAPRSLAVVYTVVFACALGLASLQAFRRFEAGWYRTRAVAESVKTISWRYMMCAAPFDSAAVGQARGLLTAKLGEILKEHKHIGELLNPEDGPGAAITEAMERTRTKSLYERRRTYFTDRIDEQQSWYARKAKFNRTKANVWFAAMIGLNAIALILSIAKIVEPDSKWLAPDALAAAAAACAAWLVAKRHTELSASYSLTAHEITLIKAVGEQATTEDEFSEFIGDSEQAFSREHAQWLSRRDAA